MGASVVDATLSAANWAKAKPKDYKNTDLDKALSAWEPLAKKDLSFSALPGNPCIKGYETFIKDAKALVKILKDQDSALGAVAAAGSKCAAELKKLSDKLEGDARMAYFSASGSASAIGDRAGSMKSKLA